MSGDTVTRTTTTTTTTTVEGTYLERRRKAPWWPVALGVVGLLGLGVVHDVPMRHSIENDLESRTQSQVLGPLGLSGVKIDFTGRDGVLSGTVPAGTDIEALKAKVRELAGVRVVTGDLTSEGGTTPTPTPTPTPSETTAPSPTPSQTTAPSPTPSVSTSPAAAALPAVNAVITKGKVVLTGKVPSEDAAKALVAEAEQTFGAGNVSNQLTVDATVGDTGLSGLGAVLAALAKASDATVDYKDGTITLTGTVASDAEKKAAVDAATTAVGGDATKVVDQLKVSAVENDLNKLPTIQFRTAYSTLTGNGFSVVQQAAAILKANPSIKVRIEGHTDDVGGDAINQELSVARARTIRETLRTLGIADDRMSYAGFGESRPKVPNTSDANRAINRRVEFVVL